MGDKRLGVLENSWIPGNLAGDTFSFWLFPAGFNYILHVFGQIVCLHVLLALSVLGRKGENLIARECLVISIICGGQGGQDSQ